MKHRNSDMFHNLYVMSEYKLIHRRGVYEKSRHVCLEPFYK